MDDKNSVKPSGLLKRKASGSYSQSSCISTSDAAANPPSVAGEPSVETKEISCPICQSSLAGLSAEKAETHVNVCLDEIILQEKKAHKNKRQSIDVNQHYIAGKAVVVERTQTQMQMHIQSQHKPCLVLSDSQKIAKERVSRPEKPLTGARNIDDFFNEIEAVSLKPESPPQGAYTYVYNIQHAINDTGRLKASADPSANTHSKSKGTKPLPSFKRIPGTSFTVDAFKYGFLGFCSAYFLTHFHSDHYGGLTRGFAGDIYCSRITANCVKSKFGLCSSQVHALPMNTRCIVHGVYVTLIDAEHCPGAAIILFEIPEKTSDKLTRIVHSGDFRASARHVCQIMRVFTTHILSPVTPDMLVIPAFESEADDVSQSPFVKEVTDWMPTIDYLYLDTTYLEPSYSFPRQSQVIETVGQFCHQINQGAGYLQAHLNEIRNENSKAKAKVRAKTVAVPKVSLITQWFRPTQKAIETNDSKDLMDVSNLTAKSKKRSRVLFVVGTYTIGKEKLFIDIACRIKSKIYVKPDKRKLLECIASPSIMALLTDDMYEAQVHAVSLGTVNMQGMSDYLASLQPKSNFTSIVAFSPTGWSHAGPYIPGRKETVSSIVPELPSAVEINSARQKQDSCALLAAFARSAHIGDDTKSAFSTQKLKPRGSSSKVTIFPVPYSEHSSFAELARFVCSLDIATIVPTVYSSSSDKNHSASNWLSHWQNLKALFKQNASSGRPYAFEIQPQQTQPKHIKKEFTKLKNIQYI